MVSRGQRPLPGGDLANDSVVRDQPQTGVLRSILVGVVFGADAAGYCLALATICFSGALVVGLGFATAVFLLGSAVATLCLFRFGSFRLSLAISQDTSIAILAPAVILAASSVSGPNEAQVATAFAVIGASALASGLVFWAIGSLGLGRLVRMFPYPVVAGFLASSGYLLVFSAMAIVTGSIHLDAMAAAVSDPLVQLRGGMAFRLLGRHLATLQLVENHLPTPLVPGHSFHAGQRTHIKIALRLVLRVTFKAVRLQERMHRLPILALQTRPLLVHGRDFRAKAGGNTNRKGQAPSDRQQDSFCDERHA